MSRKRDGARNFFPMPQKIFNLGMNAGEIAVYAYLMFRENRKTYQCYPSYRTIGEAVGMSRNTVKKYVDALVEKQLIYVEPTKVTADIIINSGMNDVVFDVIKVKILSHLARVEQQG